MRRNWEIRTINHLGVENKLLVRRDDIAQKFDHGAHTGRFHSRDLIHAWNTKTGHDTLLLSYEFEGQNLRVLDESQLKQFQVLLKAEQEAQYKKEMDLLIEKARKLRPDVF